MAYNNENQTFVEKKRDLPNLSTLSDREISEIPNLVKDQLHYNSIAKEHPSLPDINMNLIYRYSDGQSKTQMPAIFTPNFHSRRNSVFRDIYTKMRKLSGYVLDNVRDGIEKKLSANQYSFYKKSYDNTNRFYKKAIENINHFYKKDGKDTNDPIDKHSKYHQYHFPASTLNYSPNTHENSIEKNPTVTKRKLYNVRPFYKRGNTGLLRFYKRNPKNLHRFYKRKPNEQIRFFK